MTSIYTKVMNRCYRHFILPLYHNIYLKNKVRCIRKKKKIRVLFLLQYLPQWKTELLYLAMLQHPRFQPILGITPCVEMPGEEKMLISYCKEKEYDTTWIDPQKKLRCQVQPDIVFHQKLYDTSIHPKHQVYANPLTLHAYIHYAFNSVTTGWLINSKLTMNCWRIFFENKSCADEFKKRHYCHGINYIVTGIPMMDELDINNYQEPDPWTQTNGRKRVIYAPHHTISTMHMDGLDFSTFLENGEFIQKMAEKYKEQVYFVFKPHPRLYRNLVEYWGKEKTDLYYSNWNQPGFCHTELGKYRALFQKSDALIHDCGSFTLEYIYTSNPVMYLVKDSHREENMTQYAKEAYDLHYKGNSHEDIEQFIQNVISGNDPSRETRLKYVADSLTPPYGKTACQNIINAILGEEEYSL